METAYTALARRFRPQTFDDVIGQQRIAQTLRHAIVENRVAHAYLFTGARGVGKTSMARIFAKALNCPQAVDGVPCNQCEICTSITSGQDVDVSEIDGASNRGIDDIRTLRSNVQVRSMRSKYKVYIIDEVHMLTKEAFNALLKTLEEPPPNVKFVFCTTEPNKVPDTILSRCQRFDFGTIATQNIVERLGQIAAAEGFAVEEEALHLVARRANGSMRDSQSLFDQLLAFGSTRITTQDVHQLFGTAPDERLTELVDALVARDRVGALNAVDQAVNEGVQLESLADQLICYVRDILVTACGATGLALMGVGERGRADVERQAGTWGGATATAALQILAEAKQRMQRSTLGRPLLELAIVRIALLGDLEPLQQLLDQMRTGAPVAPLPARPALPPRVSTPAPTTSRESMPPVSREDATSRAAPPVDDANGEKKNDEAVTSLSSVGETRARGAFRSAVVDNRPDPNREANGSSAEQEPPAATWVPGSGRDDAEEAAPETTLRLPFEAGREAALLEAAAGRLGGLVGTHLRGALSTAISGPETLEIVFSARYDFARRFCEEAQTQSRIEDALESLTGRPIRIAIRVASAGDDQRAPVEPALVKSPRPAAKLVETVDDPFVQEVMDVFGVPAWRRQELFDEPTTASETAEPEA